MKNGDKSYSIALASIALVLFLILVSSTVSAASVQNSLVKGPYAYISNANNNTTSVIIESPYTTAFSINDNVEVSGPVFDGSDIDHIIDNYGDGNTLKIDASQFAAFYYDHNNNVASESLSITDVAGTQGNVIGEGGLIYQTQIQPVAYEYENASVGWGTYPVIGFFGDKYIPLKLTDASKLVKLVLDSDDKYTIRIGETLDLGQGYSLEAKQVDAAGEKVWLQFSKDGKYVDDEIISVANNTQSTWEVELDGIQGEDDVVVLKIHVNQVFQDAVGSIVQIEGVWLIDYANAMTIESDDKFGKLNNVNINGTTLSISNKEAFTLTKDSDQEIAPGLYFRVVDTGGDTLRFYVFKQITDTETYEIETYEIRGQVASGTGNFIWTAANFAGFYYDIKDNISTESLSVSGINGNVIPVGGLVYNTQIKPASYEYENAAAGWDNYSLIGFFAEKYIPIKPAKADKLAKLILDSNDRYALKTGEKLDLGQGYAIKARQVDVDGKKVWLEFSKDGELVDEEIIEVVNNTQSTWEVELDGIQGEDDVVVLKIHVDQVFQDAVGSIVQIEGVWLIDYANAMTIESDDEFGKLNNVNINSTTVSISNKDAFTLTRDSDQEIAPGLYFRVADIPVNELRYYLFVKKVRENNNNVLPIANFNSNTTQGVAPLSVQFTDLSQYATSRSWDIGNDGTIESTEASFVYIYTAPGTYTVNLTAGNAKGTTSKLSTITVLQESSSSGSSSGGSSHSSGGGGGSPEPAKNVEVKEISQTFISNGKPVKFDFTKNATCVVYVGFDAKKTAGKTTTIAEHAQRKINPGLRAEFGRGLQVLQRLGWKRRVCHFKQYRKPCRMLQD